MIAYCGETRARKTLASLDAAGIGIVIQRGNFRRPPVRPWFYDNGAFLDWRHGKLFDAETWERESLRVLACEQPPAFLVLPDIVASAESLAFSLNWAERLPATTTPLALVVQDGTTPATLPWSERFDVLFVGGTLAWKLATGASWCQAAKERGRLSHVGRVGTVARVRWAHAAGADSIDSSLPLWSTEQLRGFVRALHDANAQTSFWGVS